MSIKKRYRRIIPIIFALALMINFAAYPVQVKANIYTLVPAVERFAVNAIDLILASSIINSNLGLGADGISKVNSSVTRDNARVKSEVEQWWESLGPDTQIKGTIVDLSEKAQNYAAMGKDILLSEDAIKQLKLDVLAKNVLDNSYTYVNSQTYYPGSNVISFNEYSNNLLPSFLGKSVGSEEWGNGVKVYTNRTHNYIVLITDEYQTLNVTVFETHVTKYVLSTYYSPSSGSTYLNFSDLSNIALRKSLYTMPVLPSASVGTVVNFASGSVPKFTLAKGSHILNRKITHDIYYVSDTPDLITRTSTDFDLPSIQTKVIPHINYNDDLETRTAVPYVPKDSSSSTDVYSITAEVLNPDIETPTEEEDVTNPDTPITSDEGFWSWLNSFWSKLGKLLDSASKTLSETLVGTGEIDLTELKADAEKLTMVFPFCIPFDFIKAIKAMVVTPKAPTYRMDFRGTIFNGYIWELRMDEFESVAVVVRWTVWISFFVGLMIGTRKFIKW